MNPIFSRHCWTPRFGARDQKDAFPEICDFFLTFFPEMINKNIFDLGKLSRSK
jgi:hypothetical protein